MDASRQVPENFCEKVHSAYRMVPAEALPQGACKGKLNYTIRNNTGARVEVQLGNQIFFLKAAAGGHPIDAKPTVCWQKYETVQQCWDHVKTLVQWGS